MNRRIRTAILTAASLTALASCGGGDDDADVAVAESTSPSATTGPDTTVSNVPATSTAPEATTADAGPRTTDASPTTVADPAPSTTDAEEPATPTSAAPAAERAIPPPLVASTELLTDGVAPLRGEVFPFLPPIAPGTYHSSRLGTEIVLDIPADVSLYRHAAGVIGFDRDADRLVFIERYGIDDTGEPETLTADEWIDELLATDWEVDEVTWPDISGHEVRHFEITPVGDLPDEPTLIGDILGTEALVFVGTKTAHVWFINQGEHSPIVIGSGIPDDEWRDFVHELVESIDLGPASPDPRAGREPIEYGADPWMPLWSADADVPYRTLLFDSAVLRTPVAVGGWVGSSQLGPDVPGDFDGTTAPATAIGVAGPVIVAGEPGEPPTDASALVAHLDGLARDGLISEFRPVESSATILGVPTEAVEFDVPSGSEVPVLATADDGWTGSIVVETAQPARTYRWWVADVGDDVAYAWARADVGLATDLEAAADLAEMVMASFESG